jgi:hypothetical protein
LEASDGKKYATDCADTPTIDDDAQVFEENKIAAKKESRPQSRKGRWECCASQRPFFFLHPPELPFRRQILKFRG